MSEINFEINGILFPLWVQYNFKKYKLNTISNDKDNVKDNNLVLKKHQEFICKYLDVNSPFKDILLYHGLGWGKTVIAINIYNAIYAKTDEYNLFIFIKASLKNDPWLKELNVWLSNKNEQNKKIIFIHYDSPNAYDDFIKQVWIHLNNMYIIDEMHNFIWTVCSNVIEKKKNKKAF